MSLSKVRSHLTILSAVVVGLVAALALPAVAQEPDSTDPGAETQDIAPLQQPTGFGTQALQPGCYGQTDQPHRSGHVPGTVNVVARTVCWAYTVFVSTSLYRHRWYGWQFLAHGERTSYNYVDTNAAWYCAGSGTYTYRADSYHEATGGGWASTANSARLTC